MSPCGVGVCHQLCTQITVIAVVIDTIIITAITLNSPVRGPAPSDMCPSDLLKYQTQNCQQAKDSLTAVTDTAGGSIPREEHGRRLRGSREPYCTYTIVLLPKRPVVAVE